MGADLLPLGQIGLKWNCLDFRVYFLGYLPYFVRSKSSAKYRQVHQKKVPNVHKEGGGVQRRFK